jgi:aryl-alcohol dehydrogenase (NADP+)
VRYRQLANSDLNVSEITLGTMTFGQQNTLADTCAQLDYAFAQGVNFIDTAEMYPVPAKAETQGRTEEYVGQWLRRQARDKMIVGSKVAGPARGMGWIRNGPESLDRANITAISIFTRSTGRRAMCRCSARATTIPHWNAPLPQLKNN